MLYNTRLEFELIYSDITDLYVNHYAKVTRKLFVLRIVDAKIVYESLLLVTWILWTECKKMIIIRLK